MPRQLLPTAASEGSLVVAGLSTIDSHAQERVDVALLPLSGGVAALEAIGLELRQQPVLTVSNGSTQLHETHVVLSPAFTSSLNDLSFPFAVALRVAVSSPFECASSLPSLSGLCSSQVAFTLSVVEFSPSCPADILAFTASSTAHVEWREPQLLSLSGVRLPLQKLGAPGSVFAVGNHRVTYSAYRSELQPATSAPQCSFNVSLDPDMPECERRN